ncbi:MAG: alanine racemase [Actinobacteria bacterium]|nr:alanine racemase [Actinomycetota bacterium]
MQIPNTAYINYQNISDNVAQICAVIKKPVMAVVKADAYGHGLIKSSHAALLGGAQWLGVALLSEAFEIRKAGIAAPILASLQQLQEIYAASLRVGLIARVHLKVDTGMSRAGALDEFPEIVSELTRLCDAKEIELIGTWSHLACADEPTHPLNAEQLKRFNSALAYMQDENLNPGICHIANSSAIIGLPDATFDLVRAGLLIYGLSPTNTPPKNFSLKPAMELRSCLLLVKNIPPGATVGYGATVEVVKETKIGIVAFGYADGLPRSTDGTAYFLHNNLPAHLIGRVSMDQCAIDLGIDSIAKAGDEVIIFGSKPLANELAKAAGTISYEIVSGIGSRTPRIPVPTENQVSEV